MYSISNDALDLTLVIPSHFLVGESLVAIPEPEETEEKPFRRRSQALGVGESTPKLLLAPMETRVPSSPTN